MLDGLRYSQQEPDAQQSSTWGAGQVWCLKTEDLENKQTNKPPNFSNCGLVHFEFPGIGGYPLLSRTACAVVS